MTAYSKAPRKENENNRIQLSNKSFFHKMLNNGLIFVKIFILIYLQYPYLMRSSILPTFLRCQEVEVVYSIPL